MASPWQDPRVKSAIAFVQNPFGATFPLVAAGAAVSLIYACVRSAQQPGHPSERFAVPPISIAGIAEPERTWYLIGFPLVCLAFFFLEAPFSALLMAGIRSVKSDGPTDEEDESANPTAVQNVVTRAAWTARIAFLCLAVQGVIPLKGWGDTAGGIHVMAANVFFLASVYHGSCVMWVLSSTVASRAAEQGDLPTAKSVDPVGWYLRVAVLVAAFFPTYPAMILHPGTRVRDHADILRESVDVQAAMASGDAQLQRQARQAALNEADYLRNVENAGFSQWWLVGSIIVFYALYTRDLWLYRSAYRSKITDAEASRGFLAWAGIVGFGDDKVHSE
jgi:hypothetical protein